MQSLFGVRPGSRRQIDFFRGGISRLLAPALVALMLAAVLTPLAQPGRAAAAECPPGQVLEGSGLLAHCVAIDLGLGGSEQDNPDIPIDGPILEPTPTPDDVIPAEDIPIDIPDPVDPAEDPQIDVDGPILVPTEAALLMILKQECPDGYDAYNADIFDLSLNCNTPQSDVQFITSDGGANVHSDFTLQDGSVDFGIQPAGPFSVVESVPDGYGEPIVFCTSYKIVANVPVQEGPFQMTIDAGNQFLYIFEAGETLNCNWFNVPAGDNPADEPGDVTISKYVCPAGFDAYAADVYDLTYSCNDPLADVTFLVSDGNAAIDQGTSSADGIVEFDQLPFGPLSFVEQVPDGYGEPVVFCTSYSIVNNLPVIEGPTKQSVLDANQIFYLLEDGETLYCDWFNVPTYDGDPQITISKTECPVGYDAYATDIYDLALNCNTSMEGVDFKVSDGGNNVVEGLTGPSGVVEFGGLPYGAYSIVETVPDGYGEPIVFCTSYTIVDGQPVEDGPNKMSVLDGNQIFEILEEGEYVICNWFNVPTEEYGSITIEKYTCPAAYDELAYGADPAADCPTKTDGVTFLAHPESQPNSYVLESHTGDFTPGAAIFSDLEPDTYTVTEVVPDGIAAVFVLDCTGSSLPQIQSVPLSFGTELTVALAAGDDIVCRWYNIPTEPARGNVEVTKYVCSTQNFVSADYCYRYEGGQSFTLTGVTGPGAGSSINGTTDVTGDLTFVGLLPGTYELDELGATWCAASADYTDASGYLVVDYGTTTHVDVFNCGIKLEPKDPVKYPNTGAGPNAAAPAAAAAPVAPAQPTDAGSELTGWQQFLVRVGLAFGQGERPVSIRAEAADVDAQIETLEVVAGAMQSPTGAEQVAWYKDTARLGTAGNVVMAGHLNYWGVPEGVFYALSDLKEGDVIEVTGESGIVYRYRVTSVGLEDATAAPAEAIVGQTASSTLTLITCGGEWDAARSEYLSRTVVQAVLIAE